MTWPERRRPEDPEDAVQVAEEGHQVLGGGENQSALAKTGWRAGAHQAGYKTLNTVQR